MVELYYIHMQGLKEVGFVQPRKYEKQLNASKCRANQISNEDCVSVDKSNNEYRVHSQNKDNRDTWIMSSIKGQLYTFVIVIGP